MWQHARGLVLVRDLPIVNAGPAEHMGTVGIYPHLILVHTPTLFTSVGTDYSYHIFLSLLDLKMFRWAYNGVTFFALRVCASFLLKLTTWHYIKIAQLCGIFCKSFLDKKKSCLTDNTNFESVNWKYSMKIVMKFFISIWLIELSNVDSRGAGGARAPPEFWGSEKGKALFLLIGV